MDSEKIDKCDKNHKYGHSNCRKVILQNSYSSCRKVIQQNSYNNCNSEICVF